MFLLVYDELGFIFSMFCFKVVMDLYDLLVGVINIFVVNKVLSVEDVFKCEFDL